MKKLLLAGLTSAAVALPLAAALSAGDMAPVFTAQASLAGKEFKYSLADALKQGTVVVYFYPSAYTQGCNVQAHTFAENMDAFKAAKASVIGVSLDINDAKRAEAHLLRGVALGQLEDFSGALRALDEKLDLAEWAAQELQALAPAIEVIAEPQLSTVAFRLTRPGTDPEKLNRLNIAFLDRINARNRVHLTGTMLGDRFALRICVVSFRTHLDRMEMCLEDIRDAMREMALPSSHLP